MTLRPLSDLSPADWFVEAEATEWTKICLGPPGFEAYVRLQLVDADEDSEIDLCQLTVEALRRILPRHTATPEDCYFGQWYGSGWEPPLPPVRQRFLSTTIKTGPRSATREYHLYGGTLDDSSLWDGGDPAHLMWPADHAWFMAKDVDPEWIGIGGTQVLIDEILADTTLDAAPSRYDAADWEVR